MQRAAWITESFVINGVTGGVAPYTYSIDGGGFTGTTSYTNLAVGTYAVTVRDANGCEFTDNVNIATLTVLLRSISHQPMQRAAWITDRS
jgi:hypothetical protein